MRILHISDLHASATEDYGQKRVASALVKHIEAEHQQQPVDLIVFSGDLANHGTEEELVLGHELVIEPLLTVLGLTSRQLVLVPGNHDVDRARINTYEDDGLQGRLTSEEAVTSVLSQAEPIAGITDRLQPWRDYHEMVYAGEVPPLTGGLACIHRITIEEKTVGVVALNSAWRSASDQDERHLLIGEYQVATALGDADDCDLLLVVGHHPLDWLVRFDESAVRRELERHNVIYFCGHTHEADPSDEIRRGHVIYSRAGCLYEGTTYLNGYSLIDIAQDQTVSILMRTWWPDRGVFDVATNVAKDGLFTTAWPGQSLTTSVLPPAEAVLGGLANLVQSSSFLESANDPTQVARLEDLLVPPRLLPLPYKDALAAKRVEDEYEFEPVKPWNEDWLAVPVILVAGEPEAGVSSTLAWLLEDWYANQAELLPVYVPFDERFSERGLVTALEKAARLAGWSGSRADLPPMLIAFDDVTESGRGLATVTTFLEARPNNRALFGCREKDHDAIAKRLAEVPMGYASVFLAPFGRQQLRALVQKVAGPAVTNLIDPIFAVVDTQDLPRTPFVLTALVAVMVTVEPSELATLNASDLLLSYVSLLLGRDDIGGTDRLGMDFRRREYLLGSFAKTMTLASTDSMKRLDAEEYLAGWFKSKGWGPGSSPGRVLDSLIERKVLAEDAAKDVGFRQPALKHLFTAKWMLEDEDFRAIVLADPLAHAEAVCHAASLQRSSKALLSATHNAAREVVASRLNDLSLFDEVSTQSGWSELGPKSSDLERVLEEDSRPPTPNEHERDAKLDAMHERRVASQDGDGVAVFPEEHEQLPNAVGVLTYVLGSSELVDDVPLKKEVLQTAIQGWGLMAAYASASGEATALREYLLRETQLEDTDEEIDELERMMRLMIVISMLLEVQGELGSVQLATIIDEMTSDEELMRDSASGLFMTLLYFDAHAGQSVQRLRQLYEAHRDHPMIVNIVRLWVHWAYEHEGKADLRNKLETLLVNIYVGGDAPSSGREKTHQRESVARNLRTLRVRRLARRKQVATTGLDVLDAGDADEDS
jgi:predicted MPP superfamily phosphohydrolase